MEHLLEDIKHELFEAEIVRAIESQSYIATRQIVDSDQEQELLELLLDQNKPLYLSGTENLHYLLKTPFRYPPLKHGSRFGRRSEPGIFYASIDLETALCESAYLRFRFKADTSASLSSAIVGYTIFRIVVNSKKSLNLTNQEWLDYTDEVSSPVSYHKSRLIGVAARAQNTELIVYYSARTRIEGRNVAVLLPNAFPSSSIHPKKIEHWDCYTNEDVISFNNHILGKKFSYPKKGFYYKGELAVASS